MAFVVRKSRLIDEAQIMNFVAKQVPPAFFFGFRMRL